MYKFLKIAVVAAAFVLVPAVSDAADTAPAPVYRSAPPVLYDWTGFYVGAHIGAGWTSGDNSDGGFLGGGQAGFNYQVGQWVLGVEGQLSGTSIKDSESATFFVPGGGFGTVSARASLDWISTLAARAGWSFDRWLVYGKLGGAWAHVSFDAFAGMSGVAVSVAGDKTVSGWMLGVGTEYALWNNWTAKVEYNMLDFGGDLDSKVHVIKAGVNYHFNFGPGPLIGRY